MYACIKLHDYTNITPFYNDNNKLALNYNKVIFQSHLILLNTFKKFKLLSFINTIMSFYKNFLLHLLQSLIPLGFTT